MAFESLAASQLSRSAAGAISFPLQYPARQAIDYLNSRSCRLPVFTIHHSEHQAPPDLSTDRLPIYTFDQAFDLLIARRFRDQIYRTLPTLHQDTNPPPDNPTLPYTLQISNINTMPTPNAVNIIVFLIIVIVGVSATVVACLYVRRHGRRCVFSQNTYLTNTKVTDSLQTNGSWSRLRPGRRRRRRRDVGASWGDSGSESASGGVGDEVVRGGRGLRDEISCEAFTRGSGLRERRHRTEEQLPPRRSTEDEIRESPYHCHDSQDDTLIDQLRSEKYYTPRETSHLSTGSEHFHRHHEAKFPRKHLLKSDTTKGRPCLNDNDFIVNMSRSVPNASGRGNGTIPPSHPGLTQINQNSQSARTPGNQDQTNLEPNIEQEQEGQQATIPPRDPTPPDSGHRYPPPTPRPQQHVSLLSRPSIDPNPMPNGTRTPGPATVTLPFRPAPPADRNRRHSPPTHAPDASRSRSISFGVNDNNTPRPQPRPHGTNTNVRDRNRVRTLPPHLYLDPGPDPEVGTDIDTDNDTLPSWFNTMSIRVQSEVLRSMRERNRNRVNGVPHRDTNPIAQATNMNGETNRHGNEESEVLPQTVFSRTAPIPIPIPIPIRTMASRRPSIRTPEYRNHDPQGFQGYRPTHIGPQQEIMPEMFLGQGRVGGRGQGGAMGQVGQENGVDHLSRERGDVRRGQVSAEEFRAREEMRERRRVRERQEMRLRGAAGRGEGW